MIKGKLRNEMRQRFRESRLEGMSERDVLLLLLTYVSTEENLESTADSLLEKFGSLRRILSVNAKQLMRAGKINDQTACFLSLPRNMERAHYYHSNDDTKYIKTTEDAKIFFENALKYIPHERFLLVTLNKRKRIISYEIISDGLYNTTAVYPRMVFEIAAEDEATYALVAHNHPENRSKPSMDDVEVTQRLQCLLNSVGIVLLDHIILGKDKIISMKEDTDMVKFNESEDLT